MISRMTDFLAGINMSDKVGINMLRMKSISVFKEPILSFNHPYASEHGIPAMTPADTKTVAANQSSYPPRVIKLIAIEDMIAGTTNCGAIITIVSCQNFLSLSITDAFIGVLSLVSESGA